MIQKNILVYYNISIKLILDRYLNKKINKSYIIKYLEKELFKTNRYNHKKDKNDSEEKDKDKKDSHEKDKKDSHEKDKKYSHEKDDISSLNLKNYKNSENFPLFTNWLTKHKNILVGAIPRQYSDVNKIRQLGINTFISLQEEKELNKKHFYNYRLDQKIKDLKTYNFPIIDETSIFSKEKEININKLINISNEIINLTENFTKKYIFILKMD